MTRGAWLIDQAVEQCWYSDGIDAFIKSYWPPNSRGLTLNDGEARPPTPHPYVVYERGDAIIVGHSTGVTEITDQQYQDVPIRFRVHAKSTSEQSGYEIAVDVATRIKQSFDPGPEFLAVFPDGHLVTIAEGDYDILEGDDEWQWVVEYTIRIDATYSHGQA